jgi:hypothetical protein
MFILSRFSDIFDVTFCGIPFAESLPGEEEVCTVASTFGTAFEVFLGSVAAEADLVLSAASATVRDFISALLAVVDAVVESPVGVLSTNESPASAVTGTFDSVSFELATELFFILYNSLLSRILLIRSLADSGTPLDASGFIVGSKATTGGLRSLASLLLVVSSKNMSFNDGCFAATWSEDFATGSVVSRGTFLSETEALLIFGGT